MTKSFLSLALALAITAGPAAAQTPAPTPPDSQAPLKPLVNTGGKALTFDWPMLKIGTAEYAEGPTGVTVFSFDKKVMAAVDVRGGAPGTVNTDLARLGYPTSDFDAVVFAGGSAYGLESTTAVASALKDDGKNTGNWDSIAVALGAIIFDYGDRRLNEIYPDKKLATAAYHAVQPGVFRNGAAGAGRMTMTGYFFGCKAHSGQGGAFRQIGDLKIAVFTVVNAYGVVVDRDGKLAACYNDPSWPADLKVNDLMKNLPESRKAGWGTPSGPMRNTTISLVVVNQKMDPADLQRLAMQVHTSMARGIQPFSTMSDGDALYAVSTGEIEADKGISDSVEIGAIASDLMWDAILNSVPPQDPLPVITPQPPVPEKALAGYTGDYRFSNFVTVSVTEKDGKLYGQATGAKKAFNVPLDQAVELEPMGAGTFAVPGRYPTVLDFNQSGTLVMNPGLWKQTGLKQKAKK
ncbi:MAG: P1 family peptidase [Asticcacaulis sp.]|uniref:P1 family peptidase n=1 Tax=Asticcacaulis sp. TaxID=1872648 RepID=UPI0039E6320E